MSKTTEADFNDKFEQWMIESKVPGRYIIKDTLRSAYNAGLRDAAQDSIDTLLQYGTVVAGLPKEDITPTEMYDTAANALMVYFTRVLPE